MLDIQKKTCLHGNYRACLFYSYTRKRFMKEPYQSTTSGQSPDKLLEKAKHFCAFRERCTQETSRKLRILGATEQQIEAILAKLRAEGFLDDRRFAMAFAYGKFDNNDWGKVKIRQELSAREIPEDTIALALEEIPETNYIQTLKKLAEKKYASLQIRETENAIEKTVQYCLQKGFEADLAWNMVKNLPQGTS